jgi:4-amino-4-deoxy-L-arabinose transferase-like glycosyltransferase
LGKIDNKSPFDYNAAVTLGVVLVIAVGIRALCFSGVIGSADLAYLEEARNIADGNPLAEAHPFLNKPGFLYVEVFTMKVFGANETVQLAYPFLMSLAGIALAFIIARHLWGTWAGVVAGTAVALVPLDVLYATRVYPDGPAAVFIALSVSAAVLAGRARLSVMWAVISGAAAGIAYLHTNVALVAIPIAVTALALNGYRKRTFVRDLLLLLIGFAAVGSLELLLNASLSGDPLLAWRYIFTAAAEPRADVLFRRLTADYGNVLFWDAGGLGTLVTAGAAGAIFTVTRKDKTAAFAVVWFGVMLLALNFSPESVRPYVPLPYKDARYFLPLAFPAALLAGRTATFLIEGRTLSRSVATWAGSFVFIFFAALLIADGSRHYFWVVFSAYAVPLAVLIILIGWFKRYAGFAEPQKAVYLGVTAAFFLIATAAVPGVALRFYAEPGSGNERWAVETIKNRGIEKVYTDRRSGRIISYLTGYSEDLKVKVIDFAEEKPGSGDMVLINRTRYPQLRAGGYRIPRFARRVPKTWVKVARVEGAAPRPATIFRVE